MINTIQEMDIKKKYFESYFIDDCQLKSLSDGILKTEDGHVFQIHKFILAKHCNYFKALFCGMEKNKKDTMIPGVSGDVMRNILLHIYTGTTLLTHDNIIELLIASDYLLLDKLLSQVKMFIRQVMSAENCLLFFMTSMKIDRIDVASECYRFAQTHFEKVINNENFDLGEMPLESLTLFLSSRNLCISSERTVFFAIVKWIEADVDNRLCWMADLLTYLAVTYVDEDLAAEILNHHTVASNPFCPEFIDLKRNLSKLSNREILQMFFEYHAKIHIPIYYSRLPSQLNCISRYACMNGTDTVEIHLTYDENTDLWRKVYQTELNPRSLVCLDDCIYMMKTLENRNFCYSFVDKQCRELSDFVIPRLNFASIKCAGRIYVLGGISAISGEEIYDVEVYDPLTDVWNYNSLMIPISCFAAVSLNDRIYVVGHRELFDSYEMVAQVFDSSSVTWRLLPPVSIGRSHFALVVYHEKIYAIGGKTVEKHLKDVEIFDPLKNEWESGTCLPHIYYYPKAVVFQNLLIVFDNHWKDRSYLKTNPPVFWNLHRECWESFDESSGMSNLHLYHFLTVKNTKIMKENRHPDTQFEKCPFGNTNFVSF